MVRQFSVLSQARMHPGVTLGTLALVAIGAVGAILLAQRTGPTRFERFKARLDPRAWGLDEAGGRARDFAERTGSNASDWLRRALDAVPAERIEAEVGRAGKTLKSGARRTGKYAKEHAREGGALLALATIAAAVGAAAMQDLGRGEQSRLRQAKRIRF